MLPFLLLCLPTLGLNQTDFEDLSRATYAIPQALSKLQSYIYQEAEERKRGRDSRTSVALAQPRSSYDISENALSYYLPHSLIGFCSQNLVDEQICYCEGKFHDTRIITNKETESRVAVAVDTLNRLIVVTYRLSVAPTNWALNEDYGLVSYPVPDGDAKVHRGHLKFFQSLQQETEARILELARDPRYADYTLHVSGYSLGGTVAIIAMPAFVDMFKRNGLANRYRVFAYASSRPGNLAFARYLEALDFPIVRFTIKGDITPLLPLQSMGYSQVGMEFYDPSSFLNPSPHLRACSRFYMEDRNCSLGDTEFFPALHLFPFNKPLPFPPLC